MKTLIIVLMMLFAVQGMAQKIGYVVSVETDTMRNPDVKKIQDVNFVNQIVQMYSQLDFTVEKNMGNTNYFWVKTETKEVYVERKRITKKGKYRRIRKR